MQRFPVRPIMRGPVARPSRHRNHQRMLVCCRALLSTSTGEHHAGKTTSQTISASTVSAQQQHTTKRSGADEAGGSGNPELPKFSLDGLGVSRNMKVFLIVVLSIFGTMETWFYCKAIWRWWYGEQGLAVKGDDK